MIDDVKATFSQTTLDIGTDASDNFKKMLVEKTKQTFPINAFCKQKKYMHRFLIKLRKMKECTFVKRLRD